MSEEKQGTPCPTCRGVGYTVETDIEKAKRHTVRCKECSGAGVLLTEEEKQKAIRFQWVDCMVVYAQKCINDQPVSTLELRVFKKKGPGGLPMMDPLTKAPRMWAEIPRMHTKEEYRGKGLMSQMLGKLQAGMPGLILDRLVTSIEDSTPEGIAFLRKRGFVPSPDGNLTWIRGVNGTKV